MPTQLPDLRRTLSRFVPTLAIGVLALAIASVLPPSADKGAGPPYTSLPPLSALPGLGKVAIPLPTVPAEPAPTRAARWLEAYAPRQCKPFVVEWRHPGEPSPAPQVFGLETAADLDEIRTAAAARWSIGPAVLFLPRPEASAPDKAEIVQVSVIRDPGGSYTASVPGFDTGAWLSQLRAAGRPAPAQPMLIAFATCREGR